MAGGLPLHFFVSWLWGHCSVSKNEENMIEFNGATRPLKATSYSHILYSVVNFTSAHVCVLTSYFAVTVLAQSLSIICKVGTYE